ncbi:MAG TPA: phytanoyl-CoA dioxygenase family protein [Candidatus Binatia bacterium]|jgi:ectoine hydroxylase-related dioxygenase (phytanoyl-CoA dioxygenase family)
MTAALARSMQTDARAEFARDGYLVLRGLLDPERHVLPLAHAYEALIEALAGIHAGDPRTAAVRPPIGAGTGERLAFALGASGGEVLHHLAPVLSLFSSRFRWRPDLPPAQLPEIFALTRDPALLDAVEALIGSEITASPIYHLNTKLSRTHLADAEALAQRLRRRSPGATIYYGFEVGNTPWHMDAIAGLRDSHAAPIVIAWIPLTPADLDRGALRVVPGSHRDGVRAGPFDVELIRRATTIDAVPGDVVLMDNKLVHSGSENRSRDEIRLACNLRYVPTGAPTGRPYLPAFVARSRTAPHSELTSADVWAAMWRQAFAALSRGGLPVPHPATTSHARARAITEAWQRAAPDPAGWLRLRHDPTRSAAARTVRRLTVALRRGLRRSRGQ